MILEGKSETLEEMQYKEISMETFRKQWQEKCQNLM